MNEIEKRLYAQLKEMYPNGEVVSLQNKDLSLYHQVRNYGIENKMKPREVVEKLGFRHVRKKKENDDKLIERFKSELLLLYPDKIVKGLSQRNQVLYQEMHRYTKLQNITKEKFLEEIGFGYVREHKHIETSEEIEQMILSLYPNKQLPVLIEFKNRHPEFVNKLLKAARQESKTEMGFLESRGFSVDAPVYQGVKRRYPIDKACIKRLHHEYQCTTTSEFAELLGVTRQYISAIALSTPKRKPKKVWEDTLTENEKQEVMIMIQNREFVFKDNETIIRIYKHLNDDKQFAIFYKKKDILKCLFNLSSDIFEELISYRFHELEERDFKIIKEIEKRGFSKGNAVRLESADDELVTLLINRLYRSKWSSRKEYVNFLGWEYVDGRTYTYEELKERVLPYIDGDGYFRMTREDEDYYTLKNLFSRRGFSSTEEWITHLGFKYQRTRNVPTKEKYQERLKSFIVYDNKIYIQSVANQRFYQLLLFYGQRKGMTLNEVINYLGYERLYKEELPNGYVPYVWKPDNSDYIMREDFQDMLEELVIDETSKELFLQPEDKLYQDLVNFAEAQNKTIFELLEEWGYTLSKQNPFFTDTLTEEQSSQLEHLKSAQGDLETSVTQEQKIKRSKRLVREIKKLYNYRCQICTHNDNGETIPYIIKSDGTHYVEVHHIIQLSEADLIEIDFELDSYENVICVCSHHHRVLHFHNGGYDKLIADENGKLYFVSKQGDKLKIYHNLHLQPRESLMPEPS
ncbi:HNH endonuclease [Priestia megaterium]|uniref:HNH endonuclease n=1 Tax=Priestia megaterium TaxID=1404 RepID=UPI002796156F|nr:HNH endonuclease signature motif containing protein [Priestia megaterium]